MNRVIFSRPSLLGRLEGFSPVNASLALAALFTPLLALVFLGGSWMQVIVVAMLPFVFYALIRNTMIVFLIWIGTTPILSNFIRVNLGAGIPDITVNRIAALLLMVVLLFQIAIKMRSLQKMHPVDWSMLGVFLMMLPAVFRAVDPIQAGQQAFDNMITPFFVFFLSKNLITGRDEIRPLIWTLGFVTLYCAILGFQEHYTEYSFFTETHELYWQQEGLADRIQGPFESPQILGSVMVGGVVFFFYQFINARTKPMRLFSLIILIIHTFVTYWTYRRSVWMGYFATLIFLGMIEKRFRRPLLVLGILTGLALLANWQAISHSEIFERRVANARTVNDRVVVWMTSWEIIKHFPLFGTGLNWFGHYFQRYFTFFGHSVTTDYARDITSAHNSYVRLWVEGGPILLAPYAAMLIMMSKRAWDILRGHVLHPTVGKMETMVFVGVFLTQYVQALTTDIVFHGQYSAILIFLIAGVLFQECEKVPHSSRMRLIGARTRLPFKRRR